VTIFDFNTAAELFAARPLNRGGLPALRTPSGPQSKRFHPNFVQAPLGADASAVPGEEHADEEFRLGRGTASRAVVGRKRPMQISATVIRTSVPPHGLWEAIIETEWWNRLAGLPSAAPS
jgi:hypothetical protein